MIRPVIAAFAIFNSFIAMLLGCLFLWALSVPLDWEILGWSFCIAAAVSYVALIADPPLFIKAIELRQKLRRDANRLERLKNLASVACTLNYAAWVVTDSSSSDEARDRLHTEEMKIREKQKELRR